MKRTSSRYWLLVASSTCAFAPAPAATAQSVSGAPPIYDVGTMTAPPQSTDPWPAAPQPSADDIARWTSARPAVGASPAGLIGGQVPWRAKAPSKFGKNRLLTPLGDAEAAAGEVSLGQPLLSVLVRPTVTGRLKEPLRGFAGPLLSGPSVPAGSAVYAVELGGERFWCAPGVEYGSFFHHRGSVCVRKTALWWRSTVAEDTPYVTSLQVSAADPGVYAPVIDEQAVDLAPFRVAWTVSSWRPDHAVVHEKLIDQQGKSFSLPCGDYDAARGPSGEAEMVALGEVYRLRPAQAEHGATIEHIGAALTDAELALDSGRACPSRTPAYPFTYGYRYAGGHTGGGHRGR